jgi:hypothetical protein
MYMLDGKFGIAMEKFISVSFLALSVKNNRHPKKLQPVYAFEHPSK